MIINSQFCFYLQRPHPIYSIFCVEGIWSLDIIYQGQRPIPRVEAFPVADNRDEGETEENESGEGPTMLNSEEQTINSEEQENYKREFFAMLEDVIELSSDYPSVLLDPEFKLRH